MAISSNKRPAKPPRRTRAGATLVAFVAVIALVIGAALPSGAIVGGTPTEAEAVPWQVSLQDSEGHFCGGSVVAPDTIVTAAHCVEGLAPSDITVVAGISNLNEGGQTRKATSIAEHPDYATSGNSDIAVVMLAAPLDLSGVVQPIALASASDIAASSMGTVSGWGATSETDEVRSEQLLSATVPLVDDSTCNRVMSQSGEEAIATAVETCAGGTGTDSCYGDSGGPLTVRGPDGTQRLAGVVSWGIECGAATPGVYAEVPAFADFINEIRTGVPQAPPTPAPAAGDLPPADSTGPADDHADSGAAPQQEATLPEDAQPVDTFGDDFFEHWMWADDECDDSALQGVCSGDWYEIEFLEDPSWFDDWYLDDSPHGELTRNDLFEEGSDENEWADNDWS